jgi:hypothetical protein
MGDGAAPGARWPRAEQQLLRAGDACLAHYLTVRATPWGRTLSGLTVSHSESVFDWFVFVWACGALSSQKPAGSGPGSATAKCGTPGRSPGSTCSFGCGIIIAPAQS